MGAVWWAATPPHHLSSLSQNAFYPTTGPRLHGAHSRPDDEGGQVHIPLNAMPSYPIPLNAMPSPPISSHTQPYPIPSHPIRSHRISPDHVSPHPVPPRRRWKTKRVAEELPCSNPTAALVRRHVSSFWYRCDARADAGAAVTVAATVGVAVAVADAQRGLVWLSLAWLGIN